MYYEIQGGVEYDQSDKNDKKCFVHLNVLTSMIILYKFVFYLFPKRMDMSIFEMKA